MFKGPYNKDRNFSVFKWTFFTLKWPVQLSDNVDACNMLVFQAESKHNLSFEILFPNCRLGKRVSEREITAKFGKRKVNLSTVFTD